MCASQASRTAIGHAVIHEGQTKNLFSAVELAAHDAVRAVGDVERATFVLSISSIVGTEPLCMNGAVAQMPSSDGAT